jgi:hypothetical protein
MHRFLEGTADQCMTRAVTTVTRQTTMHELEALFEKHDFNSFPVVEKGKMLGIVTKFDFLRAFAFTTGQMVPHYDELMQRPVAEMMTEAVVHVEPTAPLTRVLQLMVSLKSRSFPARCLAFRPTDPAFEPTLYQGHLRRRETQFSSAETKTPKRSLQSNRQIAETKRVAASLGRFTLNREIPASDAPGGFTEAHVELFRDLVPAFAPVLEVTAGRNARSLPRSRMRGGFCRNAKFNS